MISFVRGTVFYIESSRAETEVCAYNLSSGFPIAVNPCCNAAPDACIDNIKTTYTDRWKLGA